MLRFLRRYSSRHGDENVVLADALNLLSPRGHAAAGAAARPEAPTLAVAPATAPAAAPATWRIRNPLASDAYRPSLLTHLTAGPLQEQTEQHARWAALARRATAPVADSSRALVSHLDHLLAGFGIVAESTVPAEAPPGGDILALSPAALVAYASSRTSAAELTRLFRLLYYTSSLTPRLASHILLNRSFDLALLPPIDTVYLSHWRPLDFVHWEILLLKKHHDLRQPLLIVRSMRQHFSLQFLPLIEAGRLLAFYERIVWKFWFEYVLQGDEEYYMQRVARPRSAILIWEASLPAKAVAVMESVVATIGPSGPPLFAVFLRVCLAPSTVARIRRELPHLKTLSQLKQLSIRHKVYAREDPKRMRHFAGALRQILLELAEDELAQREMMALYDELAVAGDHAGEEDASWAYLAVK
jgi:hypothetical protein